MKFISMKNFNMYFITSLILGGCTSAVNVHYEDDIWISLKNGALVAGLFMILFILSESTYNVFFKVCKPQNSPNGNPLHNPTINNCDTQINEQLISNII